MATPPESVISRGREVQDVDAEELGHISRFVCRRAANGFSHVTVARVLKVTSVSCSAAFSLGLIYACAAAPVRTPGWYADRHGTCAEARTTREPPAAYAGVDLNNSSTGVSYCFGAGAAAVATNVSNSIEPMRDALRQCAPGVQDATILLDLGAAGGTTEPQLLCTTLKPEAAECFRARVPSEVASARFALQLQIGEPVGSNRQTVASLSRDAIKAAIEARISDVRACYDDALAVWPTAKGRVQIKFAISPTGSVYASEVQSDETSLPELACCINRAVQQWSFPAPEGCGMVIVSYPFLLST